MKATKLLGVIFIAISLGFIFYGNQKVWEAERTYESWRKVKFDPEFLTEENRKESQWLEDHPDEWKARFTAEPIAERERCYWIAAGCFAFGLVLIAVGIDLSSKEKRKMETVTIGKNDQNPET